MKNLKKIIILSLFLVSFITSCDEDTNDSLDINDINNSLATFAIDNELIYDPTENIVNEIQVGVSTLSTNDRSFVVSLNTENTTLLDNFYSLTTTTGIIPAGSFFGSVSITSLGADNLTLPSSSDEIVLNLESLEGAVILESDVQERIPLAVQCPSVDLNNVVGSVSSFSNELAVAFGGTATDFGPSQVIAGPGENQITIISAYGLASSDDIILNVDSEGNVTNGSPEGTLIFVNGGATPTPVPVTGITGRVLTCINLIEISTRNAVFGGANSAWDLSIFL